MNISVKKVFLAFLSVVIFASSGYAFDFSARLTEYEDGVKKNGMIYIAAQKMRFETGDRREIHISRADLNVRWMIFPGKSVYVEEPFDGVIPFEADNSKEPKNSSDMTVEDMGYEMVDSFRLRKYLITVSYKSGLQDKYYEWYRTDFPMPVKQMSLDGKNGFEYTKIKKTLQDPKLFERPGRYRKISIEELEQLEKR